ncbi:hypothetical protein AB6A40_007390 [Gnathostoma spinigerum]|uniref:Uncharacterized protein n=1 Tax=Gnathostoma spinigerum TaxID=75299 RepID=A0ABD6ETA6_9BILA
MSVNSSEDMRCGEQESEGKGDITKASGITVEEKLKFLLNFEKENNVIRTDCDGTPLYGNLYDYHPDEADDAPKFRDSMEVIGEVPTRELSLEKMAPQYRNALQQNGR